MRDEQERLRALWDTGLLDTPADPAFDDVVALASRILGAPIAMVNLVDVDRQWTKAAVGLPQALELDRDVAFCPHMIRNPQPLIVEDTFQDRRFAENPLVLGEPYFRAYAGVPILSREDHVLGAICVLDRAPRRFSEADLASLHSLGRVVARMVEAERRLSEANSATERLERNRADVEIFFANAPSLMCIARSDGYFVQVSRTWERTLGHPQEVLLGTPFLELVHPDDRAETKLAMGVLNHGEDVLDFVNRFRCADGSYRPLKWFSSPSADGRWIYAVAQDISKGVELERLRRDFISMVSHELRTPLSSISGTLRLLSAGVVGELPSEAAEMVDIANKNCQRLTRLANDLLDLERLRSGSLKMEVTGVHLPDLLTRVQNELEMVAGTRSVKLVVDVRRACSALADPDRLLQVLVNLGSNAIRHSPPGKAVTFACSRDGGGVVRVEVQDEGPGIPEADQKRIFKRFVQLRDGDSSAAGGTGLGLAISREIVQGLEGEIGVETAPGGGSIFWVRLPRFLDSGDSISMDLPTLPRARVHVQTDDIDASRELLGVIRGAGYDTTMSQAHTHTPVDATIIDTRWAKQTGAPGAVEDPEATLVITRGPPRLLAPDQPPAMRWNSGSTSECLLGWLRKRTRVKGPPRVLVVEDDPQVGRLLLRGLREAKLTCTRVSDGEPALKLVSGYDPDLILLDIALPRVDGFRFVSELRRQYITGVPLLVYTSVKLDAFRRDSLRLGETRFLDKSMDSVEDVVLQASDMLGFLLPRRA